MECLVAGLFVIFALTAVVTLLLVSTASGRPWSDAFLFVARRFHGVLHPGGWFSDPSAWIQHGDVQGRLSLLKLRGGGGQRGVQLTMQQRESPLRLEIYHHQTRPALLPPVRGLSPVEFDWVDFRRRWHVLAADGDEVRHLLTDGVRLAIDHLWLIQPPGEVTISLTRGWLVVRKVWATPRGAELAEFVERVCALSDQLNLAAASGIEFVAGDSPQLLEQARCGVCGDSLAAEIVVCRRCNTPHHRDCWEYGGGCATYGCGGRECHVPGIAPWADSLAPVARRPGKPR